MPSDKRQRQREGQLVRREAMVAARKRQARRTQLIVLGVVVAIIAAIAVLTSRSGNKSNKVASTGTTTATTAVPTTTAVSAPVYGTSPCPKTDGTSPKTATFSSPFMKCIDPAKTYTVTMETDVGTVTIAMDPKQAPGTVNNFVSLARYHFFDGIVFHRVIPGFVVQGGDPEGTGKGGPGYSFGDELPKAGQYKIGSLAMANSGANTNGSQFFIITGDQGVQLPPSYSLFGQVTAGLDIVKKIEADGDQSGTPKVKHHMVKVTVTES